jgi:soluble lytic murein transglycosylase-like protein
MRSCFILMLAVPAFAASPGAAIQRHMTTVVRADSKTGRLVRSVVLEPRVVSSRPVSPQLAAELATPPRPDFVTQVAGQNVADQNLKEMIDRIADDQGVETHLVHSVIRAESNYNANAVSPKGAQGIMQLIPATARRFGVSNTFDARENILGGVRYLRFLLDYYQGNYPKTIAAYNAGEGAVDKYNGIPPYAETQNYVYQVARNLKAARSVANQAVVNKPIEAGESQIASETSRPIQTSTGSDGRIYYRTP